MVHCILLEITRINIYLSIIIRLISNKHKTSYYEALNMMKIFPTHRTIMKKRKRHNSVVHEINEVRAWLLFCVWNISKTAHIIVSCVLMCTTNIKAYIRYITFRSPESMKRSRWNVLKCSNLLSTHKPNRGLPIKTRKMLRRCIYGGCRNSNCAYIGMEGHQDHASKFDEVTYSNLWPFKVEIHK